MPGASTELRLETVIRAPAATVWNAIADSRHRSAWWSYLDLDVAVGGRLLERWRDADGHEQRTFGEILEAEPRRLLRCTWRDEGWEAPTEVELAIHDHAGATRVELRHSGWGDLDHGAQLLAAHREGWRRHLANLKAYAERISP